MKATTLNSRIKKNLTTKTGSIYSKFSDVIYLIENPTTTIKPILWKRSGGWTTLKDHSNNLINGLNLIGIDFENGNDAPRGGKEGFFVRLTKKGKNQVKDYNLQAKLEVEKIEAEKVQAKILKAEAARKAIYELPANETFEEKWNYTTLKIDSGLSWSNYRASLKASYPDEWEILKTKFKLQQA